MNKYRHAVTKPAPAKAGERVQRRRWALLGSLLWEEAVGVLKLLRQVDLQHVIEPVGCKGLLLGAHPHLQHLLDRPL